MSKVQSRTELVQRALRKVSGESGFANPPVVPPILGVKYLQVLEEKKEHHSQLIQKLETELEKFESPVLHAIIYDQGTLECYGDGKYIFRSSTAEKNLIIPIKPSDKVKLSYDSLRSIGDGLDPLLKNYVNNLSGFILAGMGLFDYFADFDYFSKFAQVSGYEMAWLSIGLNPRSSLVRQDKLPHSNYTSKDNEYAETVRKVLELFDQNIGLDKKFGAENCAHLINWLDHSEFDAHPNFRPMLKSISRNSTKPIPLADMSHSGASQRSLKAGRPRLYDWDAFYREIIRYANEPDGLPDKQSILQIHMQEWFSRTSGREPAESSIKQRISQIYRYLEKGKN